MEERKESIIGIIIKRALSFPFVAALGLIAAIAVWINWICNFIKYGGETVAYTSKMNRKTLVDVFNSLHQNKQS